MRTLRFIVPMLCAIVFGVSALVLGATPSTSVAHGTPTAGETPAATGSPAAGGPFLPNEPSLQNSQPLFETVAGTPSADGSSPLVGVMPLTLGPGQGFRPHPHLGASILLVSSGEVCIAQIALNLSTGRDGATVTVVRQQRSTHVAADTCDGIKYACPDQQGGGCEFVPCRDTCSINRNQSFWLGAGDKVIQTSSTRHAMLNVGGPKESVEMINTVVITSNLDSGCAGDCH